MVAVGFTFLGLGIHTIHTERLGRHSIGEQGLGKEAGDSIIGGPLANVHFKPVAGFITSIIFSNCFQLIGRFVLLRSILDHVLALFNSPPFFFSPLSHLPSTFRRQTAVIG